jgi:hypothetical protein
MTYYRPSEALCKWRHLTVIATEADVNGTPVSAADVTPTVRAAITSACHQFTRTVTAYSLGMCWLQNDLFWFPDEWTEGQLYETFVVGGYVTTHHNTRTGVEPYGVWLPGYDSVTFMGPSATFVNGASGLSFAANDPTSNYFNWMQYDLTGLGSTAAFLRDVLLHEWGHTLNLYYGNYGLGLPIAFPDTPGDYEHNDGTPLEEPGLFYDFLESLYSGDLVDPDTDLAAGIGPEVWALGPPRKTYPR